MIGENPKTAIHQLLLLLLLIDADDDWVWACARLQKRVPKRIHGRRMGEISGTGGWRTREAWTRALEGQETGPGKWGSPGSASGREADEETRDWVNTEARARKIGG